LAWHDRAIAALELLGRGFEEIEPQPGFLQLCIGPVAGEAVCGQDRQHIAAELDLAGWRLTLRRRGQRGKRGKNENDPAFHGVSWQKGSGGWDQSSVSIRQ